MLPPDYLAGVTDDILALYETYQTGVLKDMARRMAKMGFVSRSTAMQAEILQESGMLFDDVTRRISEVTPHSDRMIREMFSEAGTRSLSYDDAIYRAVGLEPLPIRQSEALLNILRAGATKTQRNLHNLTMTTATSTQTQFIQACNLTSMMVSTGAKSYTQAITDALKDLAEQGVGVVRYDKNGRVHIDKIDVAVRRATLTGVNQTAAQLQWMRADEMGCNLVETTAHAGARPSHAEWQGRVFSRAGGSRKYPNLADETGYGTGDGLCGWNCRHSFFPYFESLSTPAYSADHLRGLDGTGVTYDGKSIPLYDATQYQRQLERDVRRYKRVLAENAAVSDETSDTELRAALKADFDKTAVALKAKESKLRDFARQTGLPRQREREQVVGFGRSESSRAVWANKRKTL